MVEHIASVGIHEVFLDKMITVLYFIKKIRIHHIKEENRFLHTENSMHIVMEN